MILLAEDDPGDEELTRRSFARARLRNELIVTRDGEQTLDFLFRRGAYAPPAHAPRPDLIMLDLNMPRIDGREVLRRIRADESLRRIPIVVLTTSDQEADIVRAYHLGANSYITKPVEFDKFTEVLKVAGEYWLEVVVLPS